MIDTAEFVRVIRCRDCEEYTDKAVAINENGQPIKKYCQAWQKLTKPSFYCAWGRSRNDDSDTDN